MNLETLYWKCSHCLDVYSANRPRTEVTAKRAQNSREWEDKTESQTGWYCDTCMREIKNVLGVISAVQEGWKPQIHD